MRASWTDRNRRREQTQHFPSAQPGSPPRGLCAVGWKLRFGLSIFPAAEWNRARDHGGPPERPVPRYRLTETPRRLPRACQARAAQPRADAVGVVAAKSEPSPLRILSRHSHRESERHGRGAKSGRRSYSRPVGGRCEWPAGRRVSREDPQRGGQRVQRCRVAPGADSAVSRARA